MGIIFLQTRTLVSWPFRGLTTDMFHVTSVFHKYNYFAGSSFIILTWPCHCSPFAVTLAITCDVGVLRGTHIGPSWGHGILLAGWVQTYIGPFLGQMGISRGKIGNWLQVPMGPNSDSPCVAHDNARHWPFIGPWDYVIWKICQKDDNNSDMNLYQWDNLSHW